jgi:uncharacterized protein
MKSKRTALISGATSGIGRAYAARFATEGYDLIITGRRMDKLNEFAHELREKNGINVRVVKAELSADEDVEKVIHVINNHHDIHVLVNNAGFGSGVEFCKNNLDDHMKMLQVHVMASVRLIYAVLPQMISRKEGTIINVSSLGAYMPAPGSSVYSATKLFLASFSESLYLEVHKHGIRVQCICPGFTHTDFHARRQSGKIKKAGDFLWMDAEDVVDRSIRSLQHSQIIVIPGVVNKLLKWTTTFIPRRLYYFFMERSVKVKTGPGLFDRFKQLVKLFDRQFLLPSNPPVSAIIAEFKKLGNFIDK